jgi:hypothetical protein
VQFGAIRYFNYALYLASLLKMRKISVTLETAEKIEAPFAVRPKDSGHLTKIHSEHHEFTLNMRKTYASLLIPAGASPVFSTSAGMNL